MSDINEMPRYRLLEPAFYAPDLLQVGSIIATDAPPGPHTEPWNEAARVRMEEWLTEEHDEIDPKTMLPTGKKVRPHAKFRRAEYVATPQQTAFVVEEPEAAETLGQTLSELQQKRATDQRPGPARRFKKVSPVEAAEAPKPTAAVISAAPKPTTVTGGPG